MDYHSASLGFRIKKLIAYIRMYGVRRTYVKVRGQYHMIKTYDELPVVVDKRSAGKHVGLLGAGNFAYSAIAYYLKQMKGSVIRGVMDVDVERAASLATSFDADYYTDDVRKVVEDDQIDLVYVVSNHSTHAPYAAAALRAGKSVHIEKPPVTTLPQLRDLVDAMRTSEGQVNLGFQRPDSTFGREIIEALFEEKGPTIMNWFVAGHEIDPSHWYFSEEEGGRILGNLCHWTDFSLRMVPKEARFPIEITPTVSKDADQNMAVTVKFGDGSIAAITFSSMGHTFEGVREVLSAHKGNTIVFMENYSRLEIQRITEKTTRKNRKRDHGHREGVERSYRAAETGEGGVDARYLVETSLLFLKIRDAAENNQVLRIEESEVLDVLEPSAVQV